MAVLAVFRKGWNQTRSCENKALSNTKIQFQSQRQPEFEVNPDIDVLHQMFPSINVDTIVRQYLTSGESLNETIALLLVPVQASDVNVEDVIDHSDHSTHHALERS